MAGERRGCWLQYHDRRCAIRDWHSWFYTIHRTVTATKYFVEVGRFPFQAPRGSPGLMGVETRGEERFIKDDPSMRICQPLDIGSKYEVP